MQPKPKLIIVTGNPFKYKQISHELSSLFECEQGTIDGFEIQGTSEEILQYKLERAFEKFQAPVLVDDTSLHFEALGGFPGPYFKDFAKCMESWEMGEKFEGTRVRAESRLGICFDKDNIIIGHGKVEGRVVKPKTKEHDAREFDLFILPDGLEKTMIEYSPEEALAFSHRGNAMRDLLKKLSQKSSDYN